MRKICSSRQIQEKGYRDVDRTCIVVLSEWALGRSIRSDRQLSQTLMNAFGWVSSPLGDRIWQVIYDNLNIGDHVDETRERLKEVVLDQFTYEDIDWDEIYEERYSEDLI